MNTLIIFLLALLVLAIFIGLWAVGVYNNLVRLKTLIEEAWSGMDVQLKRRYDMIPNLVTIVNQYSIHEKSVLENVTKMRSISMQASGVDEKSAAEGNLTGALKTLFAVSENYPELRANENFLALQKELTTVENEIQLSRRYYNGTVRNYNAIVEMFPTSLVASMTSMQKRLYFELKNVQERENVQIKF